MNITFFGVVEGCSKTQETRRIIRVLTLGKEIHNIVRLVEKVIIFVNNAWNQSTFIQSIPNVF